MHLNKACFRCLLFLLISFSLFSCQNNQPFNISYEKYILDNGLEVILHEDHSDPIVAVATLMHVGSNREKPGRTGFAHFFEHMSFNDSENVPRGANRKMIPELGGERNGGTWSDGTVYYEVVPTDAFEKIMWIDSDRLGFMINTVTEAALEREKQVVKNEKRERYDNAPYGHTNTVIRANLYPPNHPYNWTVIGSLPDLQAAKLEDVKEFYEQYYGANNATLVIAGDIDIPKTKELVNRWFGEIRKGPEVKQLQPMPVTLDSSKLLYFEDNFAKLPELRMVFPTVQQYHKDSYALQALAEILSGSKKAPLYKVLVEEQKLTPEVSAEYDGNELAGEFVLRIRGNAGVDLDSVKTAIEAGFARFEANGFTDNELKKVKAQIETDLYKSVGTILNKAFELAIYNEYAGDPGFISKEAQSMHTVTRSDVMDVYERYIKNKSYIMTSFVPEGQTQLIVENSELAEVYEEEIVVDQADEEVSSGDVAKYEKTETTFDRSEPPLGEPPLFKMPAIWTDELANGVRVYGIESDEIPLVTFDLTLKGGHWLDPLEKAGVAYLLTDMLMGGTKNRTPVELEEAIGLLGAEIYIYVTEEEIRFSANTLARNFEQTLSLVQEMLLEPRWDKKEFDRLKRELETDLKGREANPIAISRLAYYRLLYGDEHILGTPLAGTPKTVASITLNDLKTYYTENFSPSIASFHFVGDIESQRVMKSLVSLNAAWEGKKVNLPIYKLPESKPDGKIFFIDVPDAKQSVIRIGKLALSAKDEDYNNLDFANQILGGGSSGRLFQLLRIEKGYTYGAYSFMGSTVEVSPFTAASSVRSNVTLESMQLMRDLLQNYRATFNEKEMAVTKNKIIKGNTREFESLGDKIRLLRQMSNLDLPADFFEQSQQELLDMTLDDFHRIIEDVINENEMIYVVVGDAKTQRARLANMGYGKPTELDIYGDRLN